MQHLVTSIGEAADCNQLNTSTKCVGEAMVASRSHSNAKGPLQCQCLGLSHLGYCRNMADFMEEDPLSIVGTQQYMVLWRTVRYSPYGSIHTREPWYYDTSVPYISKACLLCCKLHTAYVQVHRTSLEPVWERFWIQRSIR